MKKPLRTTLTLATLFALASGAALMLRAQAAPAAAPAFAATAPVLITPALPGMPPVPDGRNLYSETGAGRISPAIAGDLQRIYVPNLHSNDVYVIDPLAMKVVDRFKVGIGPQHIVPSWDLSVLWVTNNAEGRTEGSLTPIDPKTGKPGAAIPVDDPYNMYYTPDGKSAIVVAEARKRLDFRDPKTMALQFSIETPGCPGINHADFAIDGRFAIFTCEFSGALVKIDLVERKVLGYLTLSMPSVRFKDVPGAASTATAGVWELGQTEICTVTKGMPQDIRASPDGKRFFVADMHADGVHIVDGASFQKLGFIPTGIGARPLPQPRRQTAVRGQPRLAQGSWQAQRRRAARPHGVATGGSFFVGPHGQSSVAPGSAMPGSPSSTPKFKSTLTPTSNPHPRQPQCGMRGPCNRPEAPSQNDPRTA